MTKIEPSIGMEFRLHTRRGAEIRLLFEIDRSEEWSIKQALIRRNFSSKLKAYLGKGAS
ncbi:MAG: hypothetical protein O6759_03580 [Candidatus Dadabacteria bacterium]|nr:hypothetical protein [Candidatus Dadabacteria bacterium]